MASNLNVESETMFETVLLDRLIESAMIDFNVGFEWNPREPVKLEDIRKAIRNQIQSTSRPWGDTWKYEISRVEDNEYHISRILYFVENPHEITGIQIDNDVFNNWILPNAAIIDGWHRIAAAIVLEMKKIQIEYGGRMDVLDYLTGRTDDPPED